MVKKNHTTHARQSGEIATIITLLSAVVIAAGMLFGTSSAIQNAAFQFFGASAEPKVQLATPLKIEDQGDHYTLSSALCFGPLRLPARMGRYTVHSFRQGGKAPSSTSLSFTPPLGDAHCPTQTSSSKTSWPFTLQINKENVRDICTSGLYLTTSSGFVAHEKIVFDHSQLTFCRDRAFESTTLMATTPTPPLPTGTCSFRAVTTLQEQTLDSQGLPLLRPMQEINRSNTKWFAMNNKQRARWESTYKPGAAEENRYGFDGGEIVFATSDLPQTIEAASPDTAGRTYTYQRGESACVKLFHDSRFRIAAVEPGPGYVSNPQKKDEICGLPLSCNRDYRYGWIMENSTKPTPTPTSRPSTPAVTTMPTVRPTDSANVCPLLPADDTNRCKPVITTVYTKTSATARVEWTMLDARCVPDSYVVEIAGPDNTGDETVLCHKEGILDTNTDCRLSALGRLRNFVNGIEYSAKVTAVKNTSASCAISSDTRSFKRGERPPESSEPTPAPTGVQPPTQPTIMPPAIPNPNDNRALGTGPCAVANLMTYVPPEVVDRERYERARNASCICQEESRSNPFAISGLNCLAGTGTEYSLGLFQINVQFGSRCPAGDNGLLRNGKSCKVVNQSLFDSCKANFFDSDKNIRFTKEQLSVNFSQWHHWSTRNLCRL